MDSVIFVVTLPIYFEKRMRNSRSAIDFVLDWDMLTLSSFNTLHFKGAVPPINQCELPDKLLMLHLQ